MDGEMQYLKLVNGSYTDLIIERLPDPDGENLYLTHYLESNGDRFIDSEMVFSIAPDGRLVLSETAIQHPVRGGELRGRDTSFANMFSKNLLDQGFAKAKVLWQDDEHDVEQTDLATLGKQNSPALASTGTSGKGACNEFQDGRPDLLRSAVLAIGNPYTAAARGS